MILHFSGQSRAESAFERCKWMARSFMLLWSITSLRINVEQRWMIYEKKTLPRCWSISLLSKTHSLNKRGKEKARRMFALFTSDSSKAQIPCQSETETASKKKLQNGNSSFSKSACTILHSSLFIGFKEYENLRIFWLNLLLRMEFSVGLKWFCTFCFLLASWNSEAT